MSYPSQPPQGYPQQPGPYGQPQPQYGQQPGWQPAPPQYGPPQGYQQPQQYGPPQQQAPAGPPPPRVGLGDFFNAPAGSSGPSLGKFFTNVGQSVTVQVARALTDADVQVQTIPHTNQIATFRDNSPKTVMIVPVLLQPNSTFTDGRAGWYVQGQSRDELSRAMLAAGCTQDMLPAGPEAGAVITITLAAKRPIPGFSDQNIWQITYRRPDGANGQAPNGQAQPQYQPVQDTPPQQYQQPQQLPGQPAQPQYQQPQPQMAQPQYQQPQVPQQPGMMGPGAQVASAQAAGIQAAQAVQPGMQPQQYQQVAPQGQPQQYQPPVAGQDRTNLLTQLAGQQGAPVQPQQ